MTKRKTYTKFIFCHSCKKWIYSGNKDKHLSSKLHKQNSAKGLFSPNIIFSD
jgi:hypothetical protein